MIEQKIIKIRPPFDKRHKESSKNYGIGSMRIWFILKKGQKAVQVLISTNSYLNSVRREFTSGYPDDGDDDGDYEGYTCYDVGYHSNTPQYKGQTLGDCNILKKGNAIMMVLVYVGNMIWLQKILLNMEKIGYGNILKKSGK